MIGYLEEEIANEKNVQQKIYRQLGKAQRDNKILVEEGMSLRKQAKITKDSLRN